jgi:phosphoribosylaminoimidazolecarboxamide formyltransferase/IMP cyclohydrolase
MAQRVRRALVSVHDKEGVVELGRALAALDVEILSSGGTARLLAGAGLAVTAVSDYTGFPEMLGGRVKTLHPRIHAGILALRDDPSHVEDLRRAGIEPIDLVVVNLYPFEATAASAGVTPSEVVEMIDIGGPAMVRAAAKNFAHVGVVVSPSDYATVIAELRAGRGLSGETRRRLAVRAFRHTADYDDAVHRWLAGLAPQGGTEASGDDPFPDELRLDWVKSRNLRYGENPHQRAAFYRETGPHAAPSVATARQLQGKELSFNNILDFDAAAALALDFDTGASVIVKHGNPCGVAVGDDPRMAFDRALECDPVSAFGGVIAFNRTVDRRAAEAIGEQFYEGVIAPGFDAAALELLARKKNLRLLELGPAHGGAPSGWDLRRVAGGLLVQDWDRGADDVHRGRVATRREPTTEEWSALAFAWTVVRHVKSNAIVYARADRVIGVGAGQMSRVDSARFAVQKARVPLEGAVMASDAFFPFRDGLDVAAEAGVSAVVQPGGSVRDDEVVAAADEHGMAMVLTGVRHFRH